MYSDKSPRSSSEGSDTADHRMERTSQSPRSQRPHHQDFTYNPPGSSQSRERSRDSSAPDMGQRKENDLFEGFGLHMQQADLRQQQQQLAAFHDQPQPQLKAFMQQQQQQLEAFMRQQQQQLAALMQCQQAGPSDVPAYQSYDEYHEQHIGTPSEILSSSSTNRERLQPHGSPPDAGQPSRRGEDKRVFPADTGSTSSRETRAFNQFLEEDGQFDPHNPDHQSKYEDLVRLLTFGRRAQQGTRAGHTFPAARRRGWTV